jgi:FixJ family two-component response regulator
VILSSGFSGASLAERFAGKGFSGFLQKPFSAAQLVDKIAQCLAPLVR